MTTQGKKRIGRPPKAPTPGERVSLGLKVTPEIKQRLDDEARKNGRTQSQQAELMIERSFSEQDAFGGPEMRQIVYDMAAAYSMEARFSAAGKPDWIKDEACHIAGMIGVFRALRRMRPDITLADFELVIQALVSDLLTEKARREENQ